MELDKINSLVELFFKTYKEKKELTKEPFLKWLKNNDNDFLTWEQVKNNIWLLSEYLKESLSKVNLLMPCFLLRRLIPLRLFSQPFHH